MECLDTSCQCVPSVACCRDGEDCQQFASRCTKLAPVKRARGAGRESGRDSGLLPGRKQRTLVERVAHPLPLRVPVSSFRDELSVALTQVRRRENRAGEGCDEEESLDARPGQNRWERPVN